jgi:heme/copper-type cytochrome/quinol oxidase subunit 2
VSAPANPFEPPKASLDVPVDRDAPPLWNPDAAGAWSLLFSPIFGSVLVRKNWQALGEPDKARTGTIWLVASVVMFVATLVTGVFGLLYIIVWYFMFQRPQATYVKERWGRDYPRKGWLMPLLVALVAYVAVIAALIFLAATFMPATVTR